MKEDGSYECETERILLEKGYEGTMFLTGFSYDDALVGVTTDRQAVYDYDRMVEWLVGKEGFEDDIEAMEWIDYNTLRAVPYFGSKAPVIFFPKDYEGQSAKEYLEDHSMEDEVYLLDGLDDCFLGVTPDGSPVYDSALAEAMDPGVTTRDCMLPGSHPVFVKLIGETECNQHVNT